MRAYNGTTKHKRRLKVFKLAKGYRGRRSKNYRVAKQTVMKALAASYIGRKRKKRDYRRLWITRLNAAVREHGLSYSVFMNKIKKFNILLNRKALSNLAIEDKQAFEKLINTVNK